MIKKIVQYKVFIAVCIISITISIIAVQHWFSGGKILYFWDAYLPFDPKVSFNQLYFSWRSGIFPGYSTPGWSWFLYWILFFAPYLLFHSLSISEMFIYVLLLSLSITTFYLLAQYIFTLIFGQKENLVLRSIALILAILFTFNTYTFFNFYFMFNPGAFILAVLPVNLLALFHIYPLDQKDEKKNKGKWIAVFFVSMFFMSPGLGIYVYYLQYLIWIAAYLLFFVFVRGVKIFSLFLLEIVTFLASVFILNLWWFLPSFLAIQGSYTGQSSFGTSVWFDKGFTPLALLNSFRFLGTALMVNNHFSWSSLYLDNLLFTFPLFVFPFLFIVSLIYLAKNKTPRVLIFLLGVLLTSLFIVKFTNPPLSFLLWFGFHFVPFFGAFRDTFQKAGIFYTLPFCIFIAIGIVYLIKDLWKGKTKVFVLILSIIFVAGGVVLSGPFFLLSKDNIRTMDFSYNHKQYTFSAKTSVPPEYNSLKKYLDGRCEGDTVMEIPRSGFVTDAIWKKYNSSYVGQDMLVGLINCNFLSTAMFNAAAEEVLEVPYVLLERNNFQSFKNYLNQNNINYILVRHDFIPQGYVTWTYVDPFVIEEKLLADSDFSQVYKNDFFTLFKKTDLRHSEFGFGLTQKSFFIPSKIQNVDDYVAVSQVLGDFKQPVLLDSRYTQFRIHNSPEIISANCIGCLKINPDSILTSFNITFVQQIKNFIKSILKKPVSNSADIKISLDILAADDTFDTLVKDIDREDQKRILPLITLYEKQWGNIDTEVQSFNADKFSKNNKYNEASNFLTIQKNTIFNKLTSQIFRPKDFLNKPNNRIIFSKLSLFQKDLLKKLSKNITQTDQDNNLFKFRLDVPRDDTYICQSIQSNDGAVVNSVMVGDLNLNNAQFTGASSVFLKKGSYFLNLSYKTQNLLNNKSIVVGTNKFVPIKLGLLHAGKYKVSFDLKKGLDGRFLIFVSRGTVAPQTLMKADLANNPDQENIKSLDTIGTNYDNSTTYIKEFDVQPQESGEYYLYLYALDLNASSINVQNVALNTVVTDSFFRFLCTTGNANIKSPSISSIKRVNPTQYIATIPKNFRGFLTFNQSYDDNWIARFEGEKTNVPHIQNGYSNAWYIDKTSGGTIIIEYKSQKIIEIGGTVSVVLSCIAVIAYLLMRKLRHDW